MAESCRPPSRFMGETYSQIDSLINECDDTVPNLIGKIRETRRTKNHMIIPKGYKTKELIGKQEADNWKIQLHTNQSIIKVLNENKLHQEVEEILQQKRNHQKRTSIVKEATLEANEKDADESKEAAEPATTKEATNQDSKDSQSKSINTKDQQEK